MWIAVFKIQGIDKRTRWDDLPVSIRKELKKIPYKRAIQLCDNSAQNLANMFRREVRWNFEGLNQGHYVQPN